MYWYWLEFKNSDQELILGLFCHSQVIGLVYRWYTISSAIWRRIYILIKIKEKINSSNALYFSSNLHFRYLCKLSGPRRWLNALNSVKNLFLSDCVVYLCLTHIVKNAFQCWRMGWIRESKFQINLNLDGEY